MTIQKFKRLPRAGIIYTVRSEDIIRIRPRYLQKSEIHKLNTNNNKAISHQISEESWNSSEAESSLRSSSSKSTNKSSNEKNNESITSDNIMQHLYVEKCTKKRHIKSKRFFNTNQNSLIVHRGSFDNSDQNESSNTTDKTNFDILNKSVFKKSESNTTKTDNNSTEKFLTKINKSEKNDAYHLTMNNEKKRESNISHTNKEKLNKERNVKHLKQIEYIEDVRRNDHNLIKNKPASKTETQTSIPILDFQPRKNLLDSKKNECSGDSESSLDYIQHRNEDDLMMKYEEVSMELSKLKLKYNDLLVENTTIKQNSENLILEIDNLKYENVTVKTRNETLAAKHLENQNLSRIIENLNKKVKELCHEIEVFQTKDSNKTRNIIELEKAYSELQEKSSTCSIEMEHLKNQMVQKDLELKRLSNNQRVDEEKDLHMKLIHNELIELRGNIRVLCRVKPEPNNLIQIINNEALQLPPQRTKQFGPIYNFNRVFKPTCLQSEIFSEVRQLITSFVDGYNVNMITYGQSGSGKTFTMIGTKEEPGLVTHSIREVFKLCKQRSSWSFKICLSVLEIYNETIFDLLTANQCLKPIWRKRTQIHDDGKCIHIKGLSEIEIKHEDELISYITKCGKIRSTCVTTQNSDSSRSHFIVMLRINGKNILQNCSSQGVLMLCDLAGSENCTSSLSENSMTESKYISKSLTVLGRVFEALYNKLLVIPFRDSKLTHILKPSLSGDAKFAFIVTISGKTENLNNSIRVLNLAKKVAQISLGQPRKNTFNNTINRTVGRAELLCQTG